MTGVRTTPFKVSLSTTFYVQVLFYTRQNDLLGCVVHLNGTQGPGSSLVTDLPSILTLVLEVEVVFTRSVTESPGVVGMDIFLT